MTQKPRYVPIKKRKNERMAKLRNEILQEDHDIEAKEREEEARAAVRAKKEEEQARAKRTLEGSLLAQSQKLREEEQRQEKKRREQERQQTLEKWRRAGGVIGVTSLIVIVIAVRSRLSLFSCKCKWGLEKIAFR